MVHCFFEQSGVFRDEFEKLGYAALDYDISNNNKTDIIIDLFEQIDNAYYGKKSIFDDIVKDDLILAFFPCTYFSSNNQLLFSGRSNSFKTWDIKQKLHYCINRHTLLNEFYIKLCRFVCVILDRNLKCIIENPHNNYLDNYFPLPPTFIDYDRTARGDHYEKPTNYYFIILSRNLMLYLSLFIVL